MKSNSPRIGAALAQPEYLREGTLYGGGGDDEAHGQPDQELRQREVQREVVHGQRDEDAGIDP